MFIMESSLPSILLPDLLPANDGRDTTHQCTTHSSEYLTACSSFFSKAKCELSERITTYRPSNKNMLLRSARCKSRRFCNGGGGKSKLRTQQLYYEILCAIDPIQTSHNSGMVCIYLCVRKKNKYTILKRKYGFIFISARRLSKTLPYLLEF
jgi:hypothetical protein